MAKKKSQQGQVVSAVPADPLDPAALKSLLLRLGLILLAVWLVGGVIAGLSQGPTTFWIALAIPALLTVGLAWLMIWTLKRAKKARGVASILQDVQGDGDKAKALAKLKQNFKQDDPAAIFARAQIEMQEDPKTALATLEQIDLSKTNASTADEARSQRGMIHLMLGEVTKARDLADNIDLSRHQDSRSKAMMASVIAEAWARSGQPKKAKTTLDLFDPTDELLDQLRPQLYRARAYVCAYSSDPKGMKKALRRLAEIDVRILGGFMARRAHPMLQKEARQMLERSGQVQRKMQIQRS